MKLTKEQVMVAKGMSERTPVRRLANQFGVREGTLRYRFRRLEEERPDGRANQPTALDGYEEAVVAIQERLGDGRLSGEVRPVQARVIYEALARDHGYRGSYQAVVRHLRRRYGRPKLRALRRVETPPGVQAQHDWFEVRAPIGGRTKQLGALVGALSHSRARFCWLSADQGQLAWHTGHLELFGRYGGVPLWVRIDNLKTGVARGAGSRAVLNRSYEIFLGQREGGALGADLPRRQHLLDARAQALLDRLKRSARCWSAGPPAWWSLPLPGRHTSISKPHVRASAR